MEYPLFGKGWGGGFVLGGRYNKPHNLISRHSCFFYIDITVVNLTSSIMLVSLANLLMMRPIGVVSKNLMGALTIFTSILLNRFRAATTAMNSRHRIPTYIRKERKVC